MIDRELREAMDACRPGGDDLQLPEMAALREWIDRDEAVRRCYERSQRRDAAMAQAFRDVSVPAGLEQRLQAAAGCALAAAVSPPNAATRSADPDRVEWPGGRSPRGLRPGRSIPWRRAVFALGTVAAAVALTLLIGIRSTHRLPDATAIMEEVHVWTQTAENASWNDDLGAAALSAYPLDVGIRGVPRRWAPLPTAYDAAAVVYDLSPPGEESVLIFCLRLRGKVPGISSLAPFTPDSTSGGLAIGVWQQGLLLYALAVPGDERRYRAHIGSTELIAQWPALGTAPAARQ